MSDLPPETGDSQRDSEVHIPWESMDAGPEQIADQVEAAPARPAPVNRTDAGRVRVPDRIQPESFARVSHPVSVPRPVGQSSAARGGGWTLPLLCGGIALA